MAWWDRLAGFDALPMWQQRVFWVAVVVVIGVFTIGRIERVVDRLIHRSKHIDGTLAHFLDTLTNVLGWVVLVTVALAVAGVDLGAMLGGLAIGGFILGFALKDTLGNLAAGVMLLFYRPFDIGDTVTIAGESGDVVSLGMSLTVIKTADGRLVTLPNGKVLGGLVTNHTREPVRRADVVVGIHYDDDIDVATQAILEALGADPRVLVDPAPTVRLTELGANAVGLQVRPWVRTEDFWQAQAEFHGTVKRALTAAGCRIPYPQRDVHILRDG